MKGISDYLNLHATALTVRAKRNKVLASNIANAATPNTRIASAPAAARQSSGYAMRMMPPAAPEIGAATSRSMSSESRIAC